MVDDAISAELRNFIANYVDSVGHLEALLLLRAHTDEDWTVQNLAARLYVRESEAATILLRLIEQRFILEESGQCRYDRGNRHAAAIDGLAAAYASQLIPITNLIHAKPRSLRAFADAFKIKRDT